MSSPLLAFVGEVTIDRTLHTNCYLLVQLQLRDAKTFFIGIAGAVTNIRRTVVVVYSYSY